MRRSPWLILTLMLALRPIAPVETAASGGGVLLSLTPDGGLESLEALGAQVRLSGDRMLWVRELTEVLSQPSVFELDPRVSRAPSDWSVEVEGGPVNVTCAGQGGKAVIRLGEAPVEGGASYAVSALFSAGLGLIDAGVPPIAQLWVRWIDRSGGEIREMILSASGSVPAPKRFTNLTTAPPGAASLELYFVVACPTLEEPLWVAVESPAVVGLRGSAEWRPVPLALEGEGGGWSEFSGELDGVAYRLGVQTAGNPATLSLEVENLDDRERALEVALAIPIDPRGWRLWLDPRTEEPLGGRARVRTVNSLVSGGYLPISMYPLAAASGEGVTLGLAVPLDEPRIHTFGHEPGVGFGAFFPVGLTGSGSRHSRAELEVHLYACEGWEGMRGIIQRYYADHPGWFSPSVDLPLSELREPGRASRPFVQVHLQYPSAARWASEYREYAYVAQYILPWEYEPVTGVSVEEMPPSYWETVSKVEELAGDASPEGIKARAALSSAPRDESGFAIVASLLRGPSWRPGEWVPRIPMNADPDLPGYNVWNYTTDLLSAALSNAEAWGLEIDGIELDNFMGRSGAVDLRREAIEALDGDLTYDPNTFRPAAHLSYASAEYLQALREWMDSALPGGGLTGNFIAEGYPNFGLPYLDALPFECSPRGFNWGDVELLYRRFAAGSRAAIGVITTPPAEQPGILREFVDGLIFYGILPTVKEDMEVSEDEASLLREAAGVFLELHSAGWRPVTGASGEGGLLVERFGDWPSLYLTIRNPGGEEVPLAVSVSRVLIPQTEGVRVSVLWGSVDEVECLRSPGGPLWLTGGSIG
ncbi:MAG: hypothetical protein DRO01_05925, partial [Thermoproteota archaeon]